ncbi:MAG: homoserine O-succinyltransferase [Candidatus Acidiferrum sp.]
MPLVMDKDRIPAHWAAKKYLRPAESLGTSGASADYLRVALIINMPDPAVEDTEAQFFELLDTAAISTTVLLKLYSLPNIPRGERAQQHLSNFYHDIKDLLNGRFDGVIMTGTEPHQPNLREEPYWSILAEVLDWAEESTGSTVLSCLAAHAGVLHGDGIRRNRLPDKRFGVFNYKKVCDHPLTGGTSDLIPIPHSRWNDLHEEDLVSSGYAILTKSAEAGVDLFAKQKKKSTFIHFQGHPEYGARTLLKEYRRDVKRFLRHERETYPSMPHGYFDTTATEALTEFREAAVSDPREERMAVFPDDAVFDALQKTWHSAATALYTNWLQLIARNRVETPAFAAMARSVRR